MGYIGRGLDKIANVEKLDNITFDGGTTYALTKSSSAFTPNSANSLLVSIDGVIQQGNFSVSTTNIVFDWSPTSANTCNFIMHYGVGVINIPADDTITSAKIVDNAIDSEHYTDGSIDLAHMSSESVDEDNLHISNAGTNGQALTKQSGNAGGLTWASVGADFDTAITINESGAAVDFRVEGDTDINCLIVDGSADKVGIGESVPLGKLHVKSADSGVTSPDTGADDFILENDNHAGISICTPNNKIGRVFFADPDDSDVGYINYDHSSNLLEVGVNASTRMSIDSAGKVGIGVTPDSHLHIHNTTDTNVLKVHNQDDSGGFSANVIRLSASRSSTDGSFNILEGLNGGGQRIRVSDSGNVMNTNNSYGALSDERIKQDITDANSQWDDIKALKIRKFKLKREVARQEKLEVGQGEANTPYQIGVVAQELETANMNGLVEEAKPNKEDVACHSDFGSIDEEGVFTEGQKVKEVKYSVLYMKAIKALQESMERIETLEAKVTALENK